MKKRFALLAALVLLPLISVSAGPPTSEVVDVWSTAVGTGANILARDLIPTTNAAASGINAYDCSYRVTIALVSTSSVVNLHVTRVSDSATQDFAITPEQGTSTTLTAGNLYSFRFGGVSTFKYNLRVATATTVGYCVVERLGY